MELQDQTQQSEFYMPTMEHMVGIEFLRCENTRKAVEKGNAYKHDLVDDCLRWWNSVEGFHIIMSNLSKSQEELAHIQHALSNIQQTIAEYIEKHLGFHPILDVDSNGHATSENVPIEWSTVGYRYSIAPNKRTT